MNTSRRVAFVPRALLAALFVLLGAVLTSAGCGRSNLDDYLPPDGGYGDVIQPDVDSGPHPEGGGCNAATCPGGCCDAAGHCQAGAALTACGSAGQACQNCQAEGFQLCDATAHACGNQVVNCGPQNCGGCCSGDVCFAGSDPNECGYGAQTCQHCTSEGLACSGGRCVTPACGPGNCNGCCFGGQCIGGTDNTACGAGGQECSNCTAVGETCSGNPGGGGRCTGTQSCGPWNCSGCCYGNTCFGGSDSQACGYGGQQCQDCFNFGETCVGNVCQTSQFCGPGNCPGCCQGDICVFGGSANACGYGGQQCQDCAAFGEACNNGQCIGTVGCSPQNCAGCCVGNVCLTGNQSAACGYGGSTCQDCLPFGETCTNGQCLGQATCGPANCPGCCVGNACQAGTSSNACGFGGEQCLNCFGSGETCSNQQCVTQPSCGPQNCKGCCQGNTCLSGTASASCGVGGTTCQDCAASNGTCSGGACVLPTTCGPNNCSGCCLGNACLPGTVDGQCGFAGQQCQNCASIGDSCQNQACVAPSTCGPWNCSGCCQGNTCIGGGPIFFDAGVGSSSGGGSSSSSGGSSSSSGGPPPPFDAGGQPDSECGSNGTACQDCTKLGETCQYGQCLPKCNQYNCAGCCDANQNCQPGFLDTQCGGQGNSCVNCTHLTPPSTCDGAAFPVACQSQQTSCPSPYGGCFAPPTQPPVVQKVCSANELANAKAACATGAYTTACYNFFGVEYQQNYACAQCLQPFDYDLTDFDGIFACEAPYVSAACNQSTACEYDCMTYSCGSCADPQSQSTCRTQVNGNGGECSSYASQALQCSQAAIAGPAAFCNPAAYANYGAWLQAVGTHYCGE